MGRCIADLSRDCKLGAVGLEHVFVVFVWLGSPGRNEAPRYWVAPNLDEEGETATLDDPTDRSPLR